MKRLSILILCLCVVHAEPTHAQTSCDPEHQEVRKPATCHVTHKRWVTEYDQNNAFAWLIGIFDEVVDAYEDAKSSGDDLKECQDGLKGKLDACQNNYDRKVKRCDDSHGTKLKRCEDEFVEKVADIRKRFGQDHNTTKSLQDYYISIGNSSGAHAMKQRLISIKAQIDAELEPAEAVKASCERGANADHHECTERAKTRLKECEAEVNEDLKECEDTASDYCKTAQDAFAELLNSDEVKNQALQSANCTSWSYDSPDLGPDWTCEPAVVTETGRSPNGDPTLLAEDLPEDKRVHECPIQNAAEYAITIYGEAVFQCYKREIQCEPGHPLFGGGTGGNGGPSTGGVPAPAAGVPGGSGGPSTGGVPGPIFGGPGGGQMCNDPSKKSCGPNLACPAGGPLTGGTRHQKFVCQNGCCEEVIFDRGPTGLAPAA